MAAATPLLPPEEKFWKRYSPHFELPLAGATALFLHGLVMGGIALGGLAFLLQGNVEERKPASIDVVQSSGDMGDGRPMGGGMAGDPNAPDAPPTDLREPTPPQNPPAEENTINPVPMMPDDVPMLSPLPEATMEPIETSKDLRELIDSARQEAAKPIEAKVEAKTPPANPVPPRSVPRAKGGPGGPGKKIGPGPGPGEGPGDGTGANPLARKATQQEIYAYRWRFDLSGDGKAHADKLAKVGFMIAFPNPKGGYLLISDITRRPAELRQNDLAAYTGAVKLENTRPESISQLAAELRLPFVPSKLILMLPKDREEKMAAEEARYTQSQGRNMRQVRETWFDFRLMNGDYQPTAIRQE